MRKIFNIVILKLDILNKVYYILGIMKKLKDYLNLFLIFFKIGLFTFGGGYAMISVISHEVVEKKKYIDQEEFSDLVAIAESTPGPIAINSATYIGYRKAGVMGSIFASIGVTLPSLIIIYLISLFFSKILEYELVQKAFAGIQCCVALLIISAGVKLLKNVKKNIPSLILLSISFIALVVFNFVDFSISTIYFVIFGAIMGIAIYYRPKKKVDNGPIGGHLEQNAENLSEENTQVCDNAPMAVDEKENAETKVISSVESQENGEVKLKKGVRNRVLKALIPSIVVGLVIFTLLFFGGIYKIFNEEAIKNLSQSSGYAYFLKVSELFTAFLKIGLFSFGGGYGMLPLMIEETVERNWITEAEFTNFLAVAESTPGPIAINMATYVGSTQGGLFGSIMATIGVITPSVIIILIIVSLLSNFLKYDGVRCALSGMKPVICGMIFETGIMLAVENVLPNIANLSVEGFSYMAIIITAIVATISILGKRLLKKKISPIILILISAVLGMLLM